MVPAFLLIFYNLSSFITVVLLTSFVELPRNNATKIISKTAAPTIHTHGCVYHSLVVVVVVVLVTVVELPVLSWEKAKNWIELKIKVKINL